MEYFKKFDAIFRSRALRNVVRWTRCIHGRLALICGLNVISTICSLGVTLSTKGLVDSAVSRGTNDTLKYAIILGVLMLSLTVLNILSSVVRLHASTRLQRSLQEMFVSSLMSKEYAPLKGRHSGELVNRFFSDMNIVKEGVMNIPPTLFSSAVSLLGATGILIAMDWRFILVLAGAGCVGLLIVILLREPMKKRQKRAREAEETLHVAVQESLENIRIIKAGLSEKHTLFKIGKRQEGLRQEQIRQGNFSLLVNRSLGVVVDLSWLLCMIWGCYCILHGEMSYGSLAAMIQLIGRIEGPIIGAFSLAGDAYGVITSAERIQELTELPEEEEGEPLSDFDEIKFENVSFRYSDGTDDVLKDVSFSVKPGEFIAVTGISGGGKTSLFQLLLGLYKPSDGRVLFVSGGKTVAASRGTRRLFAYVPQGNTLFSGTLKENLLLFNDMATDEEIEESLRCACIDDLAAETGLDAVVGERGMGLSEGQAQRVAIARALLSNAPILLLDESTSALDEETEARLLKNIAGLHGKTCLIVTHRKAALDICSRRLHITDGKMNQEDEACITELPI